MGIETPILVTCACEQLPEHSFAPPVYLKVDFLNGCKYDAQFDTSDMSPSVSLGARLMYAFYGTAPGLESSGRGLKAIPHENAIHHIVSTILAQNHPDDAEIIVPLVVHFDEHGNFTKQKGKDYFLNMLCAIGSAATSSTSMLQQAQRNIRGRCFIVPITTGTSEEDANIGGVSTYMTKQVKLPVLSFHDTDKLAREYFRLAPMPQDSIDTVLKQSAFQVGLADTAGLPGLVGMLCGEGGLVSGAYSQRLQTAVTAYIANRGIGWSARWPKLATLVLARPDVSEDTVIYGDYTVSRARDSGTILLRDKDIGVSAALYRSFNDEEEFVNPLILKHISVTETWTWQDFEKAHALYLSAVIGALVEEQSRFTTVTLGNLLRYAAEPCDSLHLSRQMELPVSFNALMLKEEDKQSIPKIPKKKPKKRLRHSVDLDMSNMIVLACDGTPIIDAHLNLKLHSRTGGSAAKPVVLFIQYRHSKLEALTSVKISEMNAAVLLLDRRLRQCGWEGGEWLFLWVSNRKIVKDTDHPDTRLLWVGEIELAMHAPLIGRRGLVATELVRPAEDEEDEMRTS